MDIAVDSTALVSREEQPVSPRLVAAEAVEQFERLDSVWTCCSEIARGLEVPDRTLRYWLCTRARRMKDSQWPGQTVRFLESPTGLTDPIGCSQEYEPRRDADTWNRHLGAKLAQALQRAHAEEAAAGEHLSACWNRQQRATEARRGLSHDYHPFDLDNGQA